MAPAPFVTGLDQGRLYEEGDDANAMTSDGFQLDVGVDFDPRDGIELVGFGPGAGSAGHAADESVSIAELVDAAIVYRDAVERLRGR